MPPIDAAYATPSMSAVRRLAASFDTPNRAPIASAIGYIMAVVAVFEIHIEMTPVATMTPRTTRLPLKPIALTIA